MNSLNSLNIVTSHFRFKRNHTPSSLLPIEELKNAADIEGFPFAVIQLQVDRFLAAAGDTNATPDAPVPLYNCFGMRSQYTGRAAFNTHAAGNAKGCIDLCEIPGGRDHWVMVLKHGFQSTAATRAAVADYIEAVQAVFLEERIMHMAAFMFIPHELNSFLFCQAVVCLG
jgi:hypothetical protein